MLSTLLNYRLIAGDLTKSIARLEARDTVAREATYYRENIGTVRDVDALMKDFRLYSYALKAHGLEEQIGSPAFVRKILESDLADPQSFANRLSDKRYRAFAASFDFAAAAAAPTVQSRGQTDRLVEAYSEHLVRGGALAGQKAETYLQASGRINSVDELLADPATREMVARVAGVDPRFASPAFLRALILEGRENDAALPEGQRFLAGAFRFAPDGTLAPGQRAQDPDAAAQFVSRYFAAVGQHASPQAAAFEARHFEAEALGTAPIGDLLKDPTSLKVLRLAAGLSGETDPATVLRNLVTLPADHPDNPLARLSGEDAQTAARRTALLAVRGAFDGAGTPAAAITADPGRLAPLLTAFYDTYPKGDDTLIRIRTESFRTQLTGMKSVNDLLGRHPVFGQRAFEFALRAFDLDPETESTAKIRQVLLSDPSDPRSFVSRLGDPRYEKLAAAFNFGADGKARPERLAQSIRDSQDIATLYAKSFGENQNDAVKADVRKKTVAYLEAVGGVRSLDDMLANRTVLDFALKAHGLDGETLSTRDLRSILTSDLADPKSFARASGDERYAKLAAHFNFAPDGRIPLSGASAQDAGSLLSTQNLYLLQMLEEEAGATSEGTRLALYFLRKSAEITTPLSILADKALFEVVRTALGLPSQMSGLDIDRQVKMLESRLDMADFKDPSRLDKFISRFATLYDLNNGGGAGSDPVLALFGGGNSGGGGLAGLF